MRRQPPGATLGAEITAMSSCADSRRAAWVTSGWFVLFAILNTASGVCIRQSGTDAAHRVEYFVVAATLGWTCMAITMVLYRRMNANLVSAANAGIGAMALNLALWWLFSTDLTALQCRYRGSRRGTALALVGGMGTAEQSRAAAARGEAS